MIPLKVYKIEGADKDYYFLNEKDAEATGHAVSEVDTHKGSEIAKATQEVKPDFTVVELEDTIPFIEQADTEELKEEVFSASEVEAALVEVLDELDATEDKESCLGG